MGRAADEDVSAQDFSCFLRSHVFLSQMNSVRICRSCQTWIVVHHEECGMLIGQPAENLCSFSDLIDPSVLLPQLNDVYAARKNSIEESLEIPSPITDPCAEVQASLL